MAGVPDDKVLSAELPYDYIIAKAEEKQQPEELQNQPQWNSPESCSKAVLGASMAQR